MGYARTVWAMQELVKQGIDDFSPYANVKTVEKDNLLLVNYTRDAVFDNDMELVSRGIIFEKGTGKLVAYPFDKFFNWGEGGRVSDKEIVNVYEKMDGSLGIIYFYDHDWRVATRGSLNSMQAWVGKEILRKNYPNIYLLDEHYTIMVEIVSPDTRVVVNYGNRQELVLLGMRHNHTFEMVSDDYLEVVSALIGMERPRKYQYETVEELLEVCNNPEFTNFEGFVAEFEDGERFKFKTLPYLETHRLIYGMSKKRIFEHTFNGTFYEVLENIPEKAQDALLVIHYDALDILTEFVTEIYHTFSRCPISDGKKAFATYVMEHHKDLSQFLFALYDEKPLTDMVTRYLLEREKGRWSH